MSHPDTSVLAEYRAGLISGRRAAKIAAHLAECEHCTALSSQLAEVTVLLASAPAPAMPDSVAQRLDTVLAAEAAKRHDSERSGARAPRHRASDPRRSGRDRFRFVTLRVLAPVATVAAVVAVGYSLTHLSGPTNSSAASSAAGPAASAASSGLRPAAGTNAPASKAASKAANNANPLERPSASSSGFTVITSRTNYLRSTLVQQLEAELQAPAVTGTPRLPTAQINACVSRVTQGTSPGTPKTPKLVERARFQGQQAIVIIASSGHMAWITGLSCSDTTSDVLAQTALP